MKRSWKIQLYEAAKEHHVGDTAFERKRGPVTIFSRSPNQHYHVQRRGVDNDRDNVLLVAPSRLLPIYKRFNKNNECLMLVTPHTREYRDLAQSHVLQSNDDRVLEIGCSTGETSVILWKTCRSWVGFDTSLDMIRTIKSKQSTAAQEAYVLDALVDPVKAAALACHSVHGAPNVVFVDIGGDRQESSVLRMLGWIQKSFSAELVVVKSQNFASSVNVVCNENGIVPDSDTWFQSRLVDALRSKIPKHPLQAPKVVSPSDGMTPICRYYNYHERGCVKSSEECPFEHKHCHFCLLPGHTARQCPDLMRK